MPLETYTTERAWLHDYLQSELSSNSEASASELLKNIKEISPYKQQSYLQFQIFNHILIGYHPPRKY